MDDRRTTATAAQGDLPRGLPPRAERVARAAIEAMLADEDAAGRLILPPTATCDRAVDWLENRLHDLIQRTVASVAGRPIAIRYEVRP